ncbi:MAG: hypothetical protein IT365_04480 [Candidatus Hydrogenedentes bacterium]|nr:hypothetical protein [Candidatus Hydrogenedentota bacterium]
MSNDWRYDDADKIKDDILRWAEPKNGCPVGGESSSWAFLSSSFPDESYTLTSLGESAIRGDLDLSNIPSYRPNHGIIATVQGSGELGERPTFAMRAQTKTPASELIDCGARAARKHNVNIMLDVVDDKSDQDEYWRGQRDCMEQLLAKLRKDRDHIDEFARESLRQHCLNNYSASPPSIDITPVYSATTNFRPPSSSFEPSRFDANALDVFMVLANLTLLIGIPLVFWWQWDFVCSVLGDLFNQISEILL